MENEIENEDIFRITELTYRHSQQRDQKNSQTNSQSILRNYLNKIFP